MRIAMIGQKGIPATFGGVERHVEELSVSLAERGHDIVVYTRPHYTSPLRKTFRGVHLVSIRTLRTKHLDAISHTLFASIHALFQHYDIIHYHGVGPALLSFIPRFFGTKAKVIVTFQSIDRQHKKWGILARFALRCGELAALKFPHQTIVVSQSLRLYCRNVYGCDALYIPNGVSNEFVQRQKPGSMHKRYGLLADQYILTVSRLIPHKGIHYLINAYKKLKTDKRLVIVGDSYYTDAYVRDLKKLAGADPRIVFTGFQKGKALAELFSNAYLFVLPSESEGLPTSLIEAASFGRCVLASNIPENMEVIRAQNKVLGYSFRSEDTADLTRKLQELVRQPAAVQKRGKLARSVIQRAFDWKKIARSVEQAYAIVIA